jgi:phosphoribosylanthranilate isomerase
MSGIKIKASQLTNLTDARYFAAAGVHYMGFCCDMHSESYCTPHKIKEIAEWVEGPVFVLETESGQIPDEMLPLFESGLVQAIHAGPFATIVGRTGDLVFQDYIFDDLREWQPGKDEIPVIRTGNPYQHWEEKDKLLLDSITQQQAVFLDFPFDIRQWDEIKSRFSFEGIIIRGGLEERPGLKSFDELDAILDVILS